MEEIGRTKRGAMDISFSQKRTAKETEQIKTPQIVHPYGMNDKFGD